MNGSIVYCSELSCTDRGMCDCHVALGIHKIIVRYKISDTHIVVVT
jgi:hypothetical protein